jgi:chromosome segregation ATPase
MKIIKFQAENIKRIGAVEIEPTGFLVPITGPNDSGKSSVLDAIFYALAGAKTHPAEPIKRGAETARIRLDLGEIIVTRKFTLTSTTLTVEAADGAQYKSPQQMLDKMLGALSFDPLDFSRMAPIDQLRELKGLVTLDIDVDQLDRETEADYIARADVNRIAKGLAQNIATVEANLPEELPTERVDEKKLVDEMTSAAAFNQERAAAIDKLGRDRKHGADLRESAARLRERAEKYRAEAAKLEVEADGTDAVATKWLAEVDTKPARRPSAT